MGSENIFVVCDRNVETLARSLAPGRPLLAIVADEEHKNMDTVLGICRWLLECGADRDAVVYAVGGGVTTDMAGFAASIYKRGVRYVNYPTTLLCQVDAGIGGKTGVNLDGYKNILGVINFPLETRILPQALETLPERELRSGAAEMLKTFIIKDGGNYRKAVEALSRDKVDTDELAPLIEAAGGTYVSFDAAGAADSSPTTVTVEMERFYADARNADVIIYNATVDEGVASIAELVQKNALLADFRAVREGNVWTCDSTMYQQMTSMADIIFDLRAAISGSGEPTTFVWKLA